jgi:hypothetical protein
MAAGLAMDLRMEHGGVLSAMLLAGSVGCGARSSLDIFDGLGGSKQLRRMREHVQRSDPVLREWGLRPQFT